MQGRVPLEDIANAAEPPLRECRRKMTCRPRCEVGATRNRPYPENCDHCAQVERGFDGVLRGGAFLYDAEYLETSYRFHTGPQFALGDVGFRCRD